MLAHMAIAASLAAPVLGTPLRETDTEPGPTAIGSTTLRDPATLEPLPGIAKLPALSKAEPSPGGRRIAVADARHLSVRMLRSGRRVVTVRTPKPAEAMLWTKPGRLVTIQCGVRLRACWVRTYDPRSGRLVRVANLPAPIARYNDRVSVDKVGRRYVAWTKGTTGPTSAVAIDREGRIQRIIRFGHTDDFAGRFVLSGKGIYSINARTGSRRFRRLSEDGRSASALVGRSASGGVWISDSRGDGMLLLDAQTLKTKHATGPIRGAVTIAPNGYLVRGDEPRDTLQSYTDAGELRWEVPYEEFLLGTIGDYVYSQDARQLTSDDPGWTVVVRSLGTGETLAVREGRMRLITSGGRAALNIDTGLDGIDIDQGPFDEGE
jgi:hypothetical protein